MCANFDNGISKSEAGAFEIIALHNQHCQDADQINEDAKAVCKP